MKKIIVVCIVIFLPVIAIFIFLKPSNSSVIKKQLGRISNYQPEPTPPPLNAMEVYELVNNKRLENNLSELKWNDQLAEASTKKAQHLCDNQYWSHTAPDGTTPWKWIKDEKINYANAGENLGRDFTDELSLVDAWMNSEGHKKNILRSDYKETGMGIVRCLFFGNITDVTVQLFAQIAPKLTPAQVKAQAEKSWDELPPDSPVHCQMNINCGGGTTPLKKSECEKSICCQMRDQTWKFYKNSDDCTQDQENGL